MLFRKVPTGGEVEPEEGFAPALPSGLGGGLVVPSSAQMELMLAGANDVESLADLEKAAATLQELARRHEAMKAKLAEISAYHMRVRRKLGVLLSQTVKHGGDRARWHSVTLLDGALPESINRKSSSRLQALAGIPEDVFEDYLRQNIEKGKESSWRSALQLAKQTSSKPKKAASTKKRSRAAKHEPVAVCDAVIECVSRTLGDVDICVGPLRLQCRKHITTAILKDGDLRGNVFVAECHDPERWLPTLTAMRRGGSIEQVAVLVACDPCSAWFRDALRGAWQFGALPGAGCLIAHHGRAEAFRAAMHEMGGVAFCA